MKVFGWLASLEKILTIDNLRLRRVMIVNACPLCLSNAVSVNHLLLHCSFALKVWYCFFQLLGVAFCVPKTCVDLVNEEMLLVGTSFRRNLWVVAVLCIVWSIWLERGKRVFQGKECIV